MALLDFLNFILKLPPAVGILLISVFVSAVTTIVYKYTTNQNALKEIKERIKAMQAEVRSSKDPARIAELQKEMMKMSMRQLSSSTKSTLITIIPLFLLFGWMQAHMAYSPVIPGEEFTTTAYIAKTAGQANITLTADEGMDVLNGETQQAKGNAAVWRLKSEKEGTYHLEYKFGDELYARTVVVTNELRYENPVLTKSNGIRKNSDLLKISVDLKPLRPFNELSVFGWKPGWLATYIILSLVFSMLARKWLKVH